MLISPEAILRQISAALIIGDVLAAEILLKIAEGPLLPEHREAVVLAINTKLDTNDLAPAAGRSHAKMQSLESAYNYLTASDLQVLGSEKSLQDKMGHITRRFVKLGLRHPTEKTYATLAAVAMLGMEMTIDSEILGMVRQMKAIFRSTAAKLPAVDAPTKYPKTASEFTEKLLFLYEAAYQGEEPTVVEDETAWLFRISNVPLRCTKAGWLCIAFGCQHHAIRVQKAAGGPDCFDEYVGPASKGEHAIACTRPFWWHQLADLSETGWRRSFVAFELAAFWSSRKPACA